MKAQTVNIVIAALIVCLMYVFYTQSLLLRSFKEFKTRDEKAAKNYTFGTYCSNLAGTCFAYPFYSLWHGYGSYTWYHPLSGWLVY
jgi:hypothetical protein